MEFSKAFDKVDHHKLVHKLKHMGVNPYITTWIKDFLHNRSQPVVDPSVFLAYINDLPGSVKSRVRLFADDIIVYRTIKSHASTQSL